VQGRRDADDEHLRPLQHLKLFGGGLRRAVFPDGQQRQLTVVDDFGDAAAVQPLDGALPGFELPDDFLVDVNADDREAPLRQLDRHREADVADADDRDAHALDFQELFFQRLTAGYHLTSTLPPH
jgi:hypothetical protein